MQSAGMKVLRVWLDGQSTSTTKGTTITSYPSLETSAVGTYDDTVLNLLDDVMVDANKYGIKLLISMHSWNALSGGDIYGKVNDHSCLNLFYRAQTSFLPLALDSGMARATSTSGRT
jgi:aryl-phospho-beta-D-glucosidase BglC (GH1 family)